MVDPQHTPNAPEPRILIAAFQGWSDAGNAASSALDHLKNYLRVEPVHVISGEGFVDLQMHRPMLTKRADGTRSIHWPDAEFYAPEVSPEELTKEPHDSGAQVRGLDGQAITNLYVLSATEPSHHWLNFAEEVLDFIDTWDIELVVFLGAMFSDAPHSRPITVNLTTEDPDIAAEFDAEESQYEGPVGITSILTQVFTQEGIPCVSLWAQIPHYVHSTPSPKASLALLDKCEVVLDIVIPRGDLVEEANDWEQNINLLASQDEEMTQYIERLEEARDSVAGPESTGEAIAHEFEKFLQIRPDEDPPPQE